eukprot:10642151-Alexandrium_andersonii.AAC.1
MVFELRGSVPSAFFSVGLPQHRPPVRLCHARGCRSCQRAQRHRIGPIEGPEEPERAEFRNFQN